jgi:membrane protease YdiL (CAAX protease family)
MDQQQGERDEPPHIEPWDAPPQGAPPAPAEAPAEPPALTPRPRPLTGIAWTFIIILVAAWIGLRVFSGAIADDEPAAAPPDDPIAHALMRFVSRNFVALADMREGMREELHGQAEREFNHGSLGQRQRFVVLAAELGGISRARTALAELDDLIGRVVARSNPPIALTAEQQAVMEALHVLYSHIDDEPRIAALTPQQRDVLERELDWFGRLALAPPGDLAPRERREALRSAYAVLVGTTAFIGLGALLLVGGSIGWIVMIVLMATGQVRSAMRPGAVPHGIYAETFAVWLGVFLAIQVAVAVVGSFIPRWTLLLAFAGFFISLIALAWPVVRGMPRAAARADVGLFRGRGAAMEALLGVAGYAMALPLLFAGILGTRLLMKVQGMFAEAPGPLSPAGGPVHPIVEEILGPDWWPKAQVFIAAVIAAPIVEEIMFRGVFYRHLRDGSRGEARAVSIMWSALLSAFIFAIIHPQGWVAVPLLMSLAVAFALAREWRGSIIAPIVMHACSNGLVVTFLIFIVAKP